MGMGQKPVLLLLLFGLAMVFASGCAYQSETQAPPPSGEGQAPPPSGSPPPAGQPQTISVNIQDFAFSPATVTIKTGDAVKWTNSDSAPHTISASGFGSQNLNTGDSYSRTFAAAGTYDYICGIHPSMKGTVIVQ